MSEEIAERFRSLRANYEEIVVPFIDRASQDFTLLSSLSTPVPAPKNILIIGAGGTGSWFAPKLVKILNDGYRKGLLRAKMNVVFADADHVEEKNLIRQNFIEPDIEKNKAQVLAERYSPAANDNITIGYIDKYLVDSKYKIPSGKESYFMDFKDLPSNIKPNLVINLIDNAKTRKAVHRYFSTSSYDGTVILDVGNNTRNGQLTASIYNFNTMDWYNSFYMNYPDSVLEDDDISIESCADHDDNEEEQLLNANDMAATVLADYVNQIVESRSIKNYVVEFVTGKNISINRKSPAFNTGVIPDALYGEFLTNAEGLFTDSEPKQLVAGLR